MSALTQILGVTAMRTVPGKKKPAFSGDVGLENKGGRPAMAFPDTISRLSTYGYFAGTGSSARRDCSKSFVPEPLGCLTLLLAACRSRKFHIPAGIHIQATVNADAMNWRMIARVELDRQHVRPRIVPGPIGSSLRQQNLLQIDLCVQDPLSIFRQRLRKLASIRAVNARPATSLRQQCALFVVEAERFDRA
jgi:hypothetical protein